jgi:uncharacterized protein YjbI with pentapeptide repeats
MHGPEIKSDNPMYRLLREGEIQAFNDRRGMGEKCDFRNCDFRGLDLRGINAAGVDFTGSYFRQADLRGVDFSQSILDQCSINGAKISGTCFPRELGAAEIELSLTHGTRMRYGA